MKHFFSGALLSLFLITGCINAQSQSVDADKFEAGLTRPDIQLLDVRSASEYEEGHIPNAMLANVSDGAEFARRIEALDKEKPVYVYCLAGARSERAANELRTRGFKNVVELKGGMNAWRKSGKPVDGAKKVREISTEEYQAVLKSGKLVLVDFGAEWCPPCRKMQPVFDELEKTFTGKIVFTKVDAGTQAKLLQEQRVDELPTFILYREGKEIWRGAGVIEKASFEAQLQEAAGQ